jgi:hypothetical protein
MKELAQQGLSRLVIAGNAHFFSAGADLHEIAQLHGAEAFRFAQMGQRLMNAVADFPAPTIAVVHGYCMVGGLDLALASIAVLPTHMPSSGIAARRLASSPDGEAHSGCRASSVERVRCKCFSRQKSCTPATHCAMGWWTRSRMTRWRQR